MSAAPARGTGCQRRRPGRSRLWLSCSLERSCWRLLGLRNLRAAVPQTETPLRRPTWFPRPRGSLRERQWRRRNHHLALRIGYPARDHRAESSACKTRCQAHPCRHPLHINSSRITIVHIVLRLRKRKWIWNWPTSNTIWHDQSFRIGTYRCSEEKPHHQLNLPRCSGPDRCRVDSGLNDAKLRGPR